VNAFAIVLIVIFVLIVALAAGGAIAAARRARARESDLRRQIGEANEALALARADDRGWDRDTLDAAARSAFAERHPGQAIDALYLVQVVDRPGIEEDEAVFRIHSGEQETTLTLGRSQGEWGLAADPRPERRNTA
jgi:type II secretory pathway pseudopilin PulG